MFTTPGAHGCSRKLKIEGKNLHENNTSSPESQDKETSTHWAFATIGSNNNNNNKTNNNTSTHKILQLWGGEKRKYSQFKTHGVSPATC